MIYKLPSYKLLNATRVLTYKLIVDYISYTKIKKNNLSKNKIHQKYWKVYDILPCQ